MISLKKAKLCCECEILFDTLHQCPICGGKEGVVFLAQWFAPTEWTEDNPYEKLQRKALNGQKEKAAA